MDNVTQENKRCINKNKYGNDFVVDMGTECLPTVHIYRRDGKRHQENMSV